MRALAQPHVWTHDIVAQSWRRASEYWAWTKDEDHLEYAYDCVRRDDWYSLASMCMHFNCFFAIAAHIGCDYLTANASVRGVTSDEWDTRERFLADAFRGPRACTHTPLDYKDFLRRTGEFTRLCYYIN